MNVKVWLTLLVLSLLSYVATSCAALQNATEEERQAAGAAANQVGQIVLKALSDTGKLAPEVAAAAGGALTALIGLGLSILGTSRKAKRRTGELLGEVAAIKTTLNGGKPPA